MTAIIGFFGTIFDLISGFISSAVWALKTLPSLATSISGVYVFAPSFLQYALVLCFSLTVTFGVIRIIK